MLGENATDFPTQTPVPQDGRNKGLENLFIIVAVFTLLLINLLLFLFWRYKALGKSPLSFRRYSTDSEAYSSLHQPVISKSNSLGHSPRRVQKVLKKYASTVAHAGQSTTLGASISKLHGSRSDSSCASLIQTEVEDKGVVPSPKLAEDRRNILADEQEPGQRNDNEAIEEASVRFKLGSPEEDSSTTGVESDTQVYCEVLDMASRRNARHFRPISFDYCKDNENEGCPSVLNNNKIGNGQQPDEGDNQENLYENFRRRTTTSKFASMSRGGTSSHDSSFASNSTCRTISGNCAVGEEKIEWRPISFAFCRDAECQSPPTSPRDDIHRQTVTTDGNATYEQFVEPVDPIYSQTVIRRAQRSMRQYPSTLPRIASSSGGQPLYEQPLFEQPLYENLENEQHPDLVENDHRYSSIRVETLMNTNRATADSQISADSSVSPTLSVHTHTTLTVPGVARTPIGNVDDDASSPHATSPGIVIPEGDIARSHSPFHSIAREIAELHGECVDDYEPEESFPVMQMHSDRYSTGNFLNKFY